MESAQRYAGIARELAGTSFAAIAYVESTVSTNEDAAARLGDAGRGGLTIVAEHQTGGMGRKGRSWLAPPGTGLLCTTILPSPLPARDLWIVPFWCALAVAQALRDNGIETLLHWPNDLLLSDAKLAGILCTSRVAGDVARVACGVGVNVHRWAGARTEVVPPPAFCDDVAPVERAALLRALLQQYEATLPLLHNPQRVARMWEAQAHLPGKRYRILKDGELSSFEATALGLSTGGALLVRRDDGARETISLADARALR
ncbi:MAG TPA: biotin--[acetyl-CoA-carboxylase] ligase [Candidatus Baltobacteraceae bacterium]|nr:biotin--[acetyl-CoA-carboxylase] ligase [Candidatus Baltobacteraceae bacterium]